MDLILWRHAEAEPQDVDKPDAARILTSKGRKQAAKMGEWLERHLPSECRILASPAARTVQTVEALGRKYKTHVSLATDTTAEAILEAARWPLSREPVLIVGHQPTLGRVASLLIAGIEQDWIMRKGSIIWIAQKAADEAEANYLKVVLGADLAGK
ncbi:SixA phosphatase family protein [Noviherbaspirillum saxi]|uniref:Histidine phosphatase family protein n=1 Tax=Noviherbaspirillum saxi TaxID=2320863 RepID=A0A3A3FTQ0_9BURK|nr:histidine phosphatase family protein [Noviherbaspirillum saxi]RJF98900.1 histidine phosphatase family protein [Noviherbaspirillum saxi]